MKVSLFKYYIDLENHDCYSRGFHLGEVSGVFHKDLERKDRMQEEGTEQHCHEEPPQEGAP